jgi:hypothetical protein
MNEQYVPTREELEETLDELGFRPSTTSNDVWLYADGTKFVLFNEKGDKEGIAVFGDSDQHEPGRPLNYRQIHAAATGVVALDAPELRRIPLLGPPTWASGGTPWDPKMLPAKASEAIGAGVVEGELVENAPDVEGEPVTIESSSSTRTDVARPLPEEAQNGRWIVPAIIMLTIVLVLAAGIGLAMVNVPH